MNMKFTDQSLPYLIYDWNLNLNHEVFYNHLSQDDAGVFESIRTYGDCFFRMDDHLERLKESAKTSDLALPKSLDEIKKKSVEALRKYREAIKEEFNDVFMRLTVWGDQIFFILGHKKHAENLYQKGVVLKTTVVRRPFTNAGAPQIKTHGYQAGVWAAIQPREDTYEWLFLDTQGYVAEVSIGNLFMVKKNVLMTPPARGILDGVTRRFVLECAFRMKLQVKEIPLTRHEVFNADEVFLTNTSWELMPVSEVDRRIIGQVMPGVLTQAIHQEFKKEVQKECQIQK